MGVSALSRSCNAILLAALAQELWPTRSRTRNRPLMRTLVTGGAGFIGSNLVDRLLADGGEVVVVDNFDPFYARDRKRANLADAPGSPRFRLVELDIRDAERGRRWSSRRRPDAIVHLAAQAGVRPSIDDPRALRRGQRGRGRSTCSQAACRLEPRPRFVYASSSSVYGDRPDAPFRETDPVDLPVSPYAATKKACELLAHTFHHLHGLPVTGLRFFTAYGPRNRPDLAIAKFAAPDRPGRARADVRRRHDPPRLHVRRRHRRRHRPRRRALHGPPPLQPRQLRPDRAARDDRRASATPSARRPIIEPCPSSPATSARPTPTSLAPPPSWATRLGRRSRRAATVRRLVSQCRFQPLTAICRFERAWKSRGFPQFPTPQLFRSSRLHKPSLCSTPGVFRSGPPMFGPRDARSRWSVSSIGRILIAVAAVAVFVQATQFRGFNVQSAQYVVSNAPTETAASPERREAARALGRLEPASGLVLVGAGPATRIDQVLVKRGDWVESGAVLAFLEGRAQAREATRAGRGPQGPGRPSKGLGKQKLAIERELADKTRIIEKETAEKVVAIAKQRFDMTKDEYKRLPSNTPDQRRVRTRQQLLRGRDPGAQGHAGIDPHRWGQRTPRETTQARRRHARRQGTGHRLAQPPNRGRQGGRRPDRSPPRAGRVLELFAAGRSRPARSSRSATRNQWSRSPRSFSPTSFSSTSATRRRCASSTRPSPARSRTSAPSSAATRSPTSTPRLQDRRVVKVTVQLDKSALAAKLVNLEVSVLIKRGNPVNASTRGTASR